MGKAGICGPVRTFAKSADCFWTVDIGFLCQPLEISLAQSVKAFDCPAGRRNRKGGSIQAPSASPCPQSLTCHNRTIDTKSFREFRGTSQVCKTTSAYDTCSDCWIEEEQLGTVWVLSPAPWWCPVRKKKKTQAESMWMSVAQFQCLDFHIAGDSRLNDWPASVDHRLPSCVLCSDRGCSYVVKALGHEEGLCLVQSNMSGWVRAIGYSFEPVSPITGASCRFHQKIWSSNINSTMTGRRASEIRPH